MDTQQARDLIAGKKVAIDNESAAYQAALDIIDAKLNLELTDLVTEKAKTAELQQKLADVKNLATTL